MESALLASDPAISLEDDVRNRYCRGQPIDHSPEAPDYAFRRSHGPGWAATFSKRTSVGTRNDVSLIA